MKKIAILVLGIILALNLCACSCSNMDPATEPSTTVPSTGNTMMPTENMTVPVPETNIPDPEVNGNSTNNGMNDMGDAGNYGINNGTGPIS